MLPTDLTEDWEKDGSLQKWDDVWGVVNKQVLFRKDWKVAKKKDGRGLG